VRFELEVDAGVTALGEGSGDPLFSWAAGDDSGAPVLLFAATNNPLFVCESGDASGQAILVWESGN
jgi:hypothetical protein